MFMFLVDKSIEKIQLFKKIFSRILLGLEITLVLVAEKRRRVGERK